MRTTLTIDDDLLAKASRLTASLGRSALVCERPKALIDRESAKRLALLGGTQPELKSLRRRRREIQGCLSRESYAPRAHRGDLMSRDQRFDDEAARLGYSFEGEIKVGGNYVPLIRQGDLVYVSGQIPRVGDTVVVTGAVGADLSLTQAQLGARVCIMRALALLKQSLGSLDHIGAILRISVYVQSAPSFTQQSEVADGASDLLKEVLGAAGVHARTSVGVLQLPKSAAVEIDLIAVVAAT
jgi:enamine deaminase RidA (YjgF/YER057c/UK114 family)